MDFPAGLAKKNTNLTAFPKLDSGYFYYLHLFMCNNRGAVNNKNNKEKKANLSSRPRFLFDIRFTSISISSIKPDQPSLLKNKMGVIDHTDRHIR